MLTSVLRFRRVRARWKRETMLYHMDVEMEQKEMVKMAPIDGAPTAMRTYVSCSGYLGRKGEAHEDEWKKPHARRQRGRKD